MSQKKYNISSHRFRELYHYCLQYNEWIDELKYKYDTLKSAQVNDMPASRTKTDATGNLAARRAILSKKCEVIEQCALETDANICQYIIKAVTNEGITYTYLREVMNIPYSHNTWYDRRKKFYWLLDKKI